jgi:hypothetical protein
MSKVQKDTIYSKKTTHLTYWILGVCLLYSLLSFFFSLRPSDYSVETLFAPFDFSISSNSTNKCTPLENPPRLELVHIPKTGGSSLELLAAENGIPWSVCHWRPWCDEDGQIKCPNYTAVDSQNMHNVFPVANWHVPPMYFDAANDDNDTAIATFNPYRDNTTRLFVVVRDPYDCIVSEYKYFPSWLKKDGWDRANATQLNQWVLRTLSHIKNAQPGSKPYFVRDAHMVPQYDYIRGNEHRMHILRQERLAHEFTCLAHVFQLPEAMVVAKNLMHSNRGAGSLSKHDLSPNALRLIEQVYAEDFRLLEYPKFAKE